MLHSAVDSNIIMEKKAYCKRKMKKPKKVSKKVLTKEERSDKL